MPMPSAFSRVRIGALILSVLSTGFLSALAPILAVSAKAAVAPVAAPAVTTQNAPILAKISTYLDGLKTVTAKFLQVAPDGSVRSGNAILQRPGKMRFQYDKPDPQLLVAGFGLLVYHDPQLNQTTNLPLSSTPLGILLAPKVHFSGKVTVTKISQPPGEVQISLIRTGKAAQGHLTLIFSTDPLELRQWRVTDAQAATTQVSLYNLHAAPPFPDKDFRYIANNSPNPNGGGG
ncbi:MAG TPA: outer membrane lipoprotein carrier protein LolA [Acidiphilium sp.]|nr:outer membrane lipoprotein carrier protein LolA [Acidiphilium sp.]HQU22981.1 outer membrane lipoprotein carrier protein LolA [Acidiphilium sp.]